MFESKANPAPPASHVAASKSVRGQFFPLDTSVVREIASRCGTAEEVAAYIVLAAHTQGQGPNRHRLSSAGTRAVYTYTGMPIRRAQKAVKTLAEFGFVTPAEEARRAFGEELVPQHFGKSRIQPRFLVNGNQHDIEKAVNLPHSLIRGVLAGNTLASAIGQVRRALESEGDGEIDAMTPPPPLTRLYQQIEDDPGEGVTTPDARLDSLMLLVCLYQHHRLEECGGVDPRRGLYRRWAAAESGDETLTKLDISAVVAGHEPSGL